MQAIGYKEILDYLEGICSIQEAADKIKMESRRYAKRQISWFKRSGINWITPNTTINPNKYL
jgi:tRNA dimethylallyltransferase